MPDGRLADPDCTLGADPRTDPRTVAALAPYGLDGGFPPPPVTTASPLADKLAYVAALEEGTCQRSTRWVRPHPYPNA